MQEFFRRGRHGAAVVSATVVAILGASNAACADDSVARGWNETVLAAIRKDTPRPPVHARNLFHLSVAMYDAWAVYEPTARHYLFAEKHAAVDRTAAQHETISYAAYRLLRHRFAASPNAALILAALDARMAALGYPTSVTTTEGNAPAAVGNRLAAQLIAGTMADGSREAQGYQAESGSYPPVNPPLIVGLPFNSTLVDASHWQPLALSHTFDANGNAVPGTVQNRLAPHWGFVQPFGLLSSDMDPARPGVYFDPPHVPLLNDEGDAEYRAGHEDVLWRTSWLSPDDGVTIDISPSAIGNNPLGADTGTGHAVNPATGAPYPANIVRRGDWARCMAEFWADGPQSSTPPGHWNEIANAVVEHPGFVRRIGGEGPELSPLEWDVKMYVMLNGALHDAAITAWGVKTHYDGSRPITAIRHLAGNGQCSDPSLPSFDLDGVNLLPGVVELVTEATAAPGERHAHLADHVGAIAVVGWPGVPANPETEHSGVEWILAGEWVPYQRADFVTPPFAGYVSGHSTFSRSAAEVLARITGSAFFPGGLATYTCEANDFLVFEAGPSQDLEFQWATFHDAADAAGQSRIYGGIHPTFDDFPGRVLGHQIAGRSHERSLDLFEPIDPAPPCPADLDGDGLVDGHDLGQLLVLWGTTQASADLDGDGVVGGGDLAVLLGQWGACK
jgi:hypothetical protein